MIFLSAIYSAKRGLQDKASWGSLPPCNSRHRNYASSAAVYVATCCSVSQCVAVCCSVLQCVAVCCSVLQCVAVCCNVLECVALSKNEASYGCLCHPVMADTEIMHQVYECVWQCVAVCCSVLQYLKMRHPVCRWHPVNSVFAIL